MEKETQSGDREFAVAVSKRWVEASDWVVVIVGWNYGTVSDEEGANGLSVTEWEDRDAVTLLKKTFVFVAGDPRRQRQTSIGCPPKRMRTSIRTGICRSAERGADSEAQEVQRGPRDAARANVRKPGEFP